MQTLTIVGVSILLSLAPTQTPAADFGRVVLAVRPAPAVVHQAWVERQLAFRLASAFTGITTTDVVARERSRLTALQPGTEIFDIPGFTVQDGAATGQFSDASYSASSAGIAVMHHGVVVARYSSRAIVTTTPAAVEWYVAPGHRVPPRFANLAPATVVP